MVDDVLRWVGCALFLNGAPRSTPTQRTRWPLIDAAIRRDSPALAQASDCLHEAGLAFEAVALEECGLLDWARSQCDQGLVLTIVDDQYPARWRRVFGSSAPVVLWKAGDLPNCSYTAMVGTRRPTAPQRLWAEQAAAGTTILSGGAAGIDSIAAASAPHALEILPFGIQRHSRPYPALSLCAPWQEFTTAAAMERNALIYAAAERAIVIGPRLKVGGTWHGAAYALRKRLTTVEVLDDGSPGARALIALGATPIQGLEKKGAGGISLSPSIHSGTCCVNPLTTLL